MPINFGEHSANGHVRSKVAVIGDKAQIEAAKLPERIASLRSNFSHRLTPRLMRRPALCLENLSIDGLAKTELAKSMLDAASNQVLSQWKCKSLEPGMGMAGM